MTEHAELTRLCDEISRLIPSDSLNTNTATSQFKEFLTKLKDNHVKPQEINAIIKAYNYFNLLICLIISIAPNTDKVATITYPKIINISILCV